MLKRKRYARRKANIKNTDRLRTKIAIVFKRTLKMLTLVSVVMAVALAMWRLYGELLESPYLEIKKIKVEGLKVLKQRQVVKMLMAQGEKNILAFDVSAAESMLRDEPFVEDVSIQRVLPDTLVVKIKEPVPSAIVRLDGLYLVDSRARLFKRYSVKDGLSLPLITGLEGLDEAGVKEGLKRAIEFMALLEQSGLFSQREISELHIDAVKGFTVVTRDDGVKVCFGREGFDRKLLRLASFVEARGGDMRGIDYINLNDYRGVVVRFATPNVTKEGGMG